MRAAACNWCSMRLSVRASIAPGVWLCASAYAVVGGRRLQLEVERTAEALAQSQTPGAIDARTERRMEHQLHAAALIEEALSDDGRVSGHGAQQRTADGDVLVRLFSAALIERALALEKFDGFRASARGNRFSQA